MIKEKEYRALIERLNNPQNAERKRNLSIISKGYDLAFHFKRINEYITHSDHANPVTLQLLELDYVVSLQKAKELMDQQGWK